MVFRKTMNAKKLGKIYYFVEGIIQKKRISFHHVIIDTDRFDNLKTLKNEYSVTPITRFFIK